jgi:hypothetical protein
MSRKISNQRCFKIPKDKLDLFLVKLRMSASEYASFEAEWVFENGPDYDVVVNQYGSYPYMTTEVEEFAAKVRAGADGKS